MQEEAYNRVRADDFGSFTFTSKQSLEAFLRRCEKLDADYEATLYLEDGGEIDASRYDGGLRDFDTAIVRVDAGDLRPLRYLIKT